jgi:TonB family protein
MPEVWKKWEGQVVNGEFQLLKYLGSSDHCAVFLTERADREPREAAIKLIVANGENPELQLSWWELAAKLSHPNLLRLFQMGRCQLDGTELLYAVSEYAEESLAQILPHRALNSAETRDTLQPLLDVLAYIHSKRFVHGHIKPTNIMAVGDQIKLSSDGLCGAGESSRVLGVLGSYAAPEIADGGGMSSASDVWSLGITLVEALTQRPPVLEGTEQTELVLPETLPQPFFDIASHCLRRNPRNRWTVAEIAARLQSSSLALPEKKTAPPKSAFAKRGYKISAIAVGLLLLMILAPRLLNRHSASEVRSSSKIESSKGQPEPKQEAQAGDSTQVARNRDNEQPSGGVASSNASFPAAKYVAAENSSSESARGAVVQQVSPDVSRSARNTIQGKIRVRVRLNVDSSGKVVRAKFDSPGPSKYFASRALQAAQRWTFKPPQVDGKAVASEWILKFEFGRVGTNVYPAQISR